MVEIGIFRSELNQCGFKFEKGCSKEWGLGTKDDVKVGWDTVNGITRMGFDPLGCFNKSGSCGVLALFPMREQDYERMLQYLHGTILGTGVMHDMWISESPHSWSGKIKIFGESVKRDAC